MDGCFHKGGVAMATQFFFFFKWVGIYLYLATPNNIYLATPNFILSGII